MSPTISDLFSFILELISAYITVVILNSLYHHKSFYQIYLDISKPDQTEDKKIKIIDHLHSYIHEYSDEEILFFNLIFKKKSLQYWFNVLLVILMLITFVMVGSKLIEDFGITILVFLTVILCFLPIIWLWKKYNKLGIVQTPVRTLVEIFSRHMIKIAVVYLVFAAIFVFILLLLVVLINVLLLFSIGSLNELSVHVLNILGSYFNSPIGIELKLRLSN